MPDDTGPGLETRARRLLKRYRLVSVIARRQFASLRNEKTIVFAIIVQLVVASFSSFLVVGLVSLYDPSGAQSQQQLDVSLTGEAGDEIGGYVQQAGGLSVQPTASVDAATDAFTSGKTDAIIRAEYTEANRISVSVTAPETGIASTVAVVRTKRALKSFERDKREQLAGDVDTKTLHLSQESDTSPYISFTYTVLVPLLIILPGFISGSIVVDTILEDRNLGMIELLRSSPLEDADIARGKLLVPILLGPGQMIAWFLLLGLNGTSLYHPGLLVVIGVGLTLFTVSVGSLVAQYADDRGEAQFLYSVILMTTLALTTALPEQPNITVAKLGMGSYTQTTYLLTALYLGGGIVVYALVMRNFSFD